MAAGDPKFVSGDLLTDGFVIKKTGGTPVFLHWQDGSVKGEIADKEYANPANPTVLEVQTMRKKPLELDVTSLIPTPGTEEYEALLVESSDSWEVVQWPGRPVAAINAMGPFFISKSNADSKIQDFSELKITLKGKGHNAVAQSGSGGGGTS